MKKYLKNNSGLTLVEILAALVLLSIVLVAFMTFFTQSAKFTAHNHETLTAVQVAEDVVGQLREGEDSILSVGKICSAEDIENRAFVFSSCENIDDYNDDYNILLFEMDGPTEGLKKVKVIVKSLDGRGINEPEFETEMYYEVGA
ncbi:type IV pilus modification PilV family protein [Metaplanococcus flavidus]|uniref:Prepilin-type N-terminal cleavage/methylation domain-containing protein n=1 Tax=Metaplanococcus flavidus TaxID=569883 RepID=A0ABW3LAK8_9BACL